MHTDKFNRLSGTHDPLLAAGGVPQDISGTDITGTLSTNWLDITHDGGWIGEGYPLCVRFLVTEAISLADPDGVHELQVIASPRTTLTGIVFAPAAVSAANNTITSVAHGLGNGTLMTLTTVTTLPAGLALATYYFVVQATADTFKLSLTPGGAEVDITDAGTGNHTAVWLPEILGSKVLPFGRLLAGHYVDLPIGFQPGSPTPPKHRYIFARYIQASGTLISGKVFADVMTNRQDSELYAASGFSIS